MAEKSSDRTLDLILGQLEKLAENQERLTEELQKTNIELTKMAGIRHAVVAIKDWKEDVDRVVNVDDLKKIKQFYSEHQDISSDIEDLYLISGELRSSSDDYKKFKLRIMTAVTIISFLFTTAITILGIFFKSH